MNRATKWFGLGVLALAIWPASTASAGLALSLSQIQDDEVSVFQQLGVGPFHPYATYVTYTQSQNQATLNDPLNTQQSGVDGTGFLSSTNGGSASVSPGLPTSFDDLSFSVQSAGTASETSGFRIATIDNSETYTANFTPDATGTYQFSTTFNSAGVGGGSVTFGILSGATLFSLDSSTANGQTVTEQLTLMAGVTYSLTGEATSIGAVNELFEDVPGSLSGSSVVTFDLTTTSVPEPSTLTLALTACMGIFAWLGLFRKRKLGTRPM